MRSELYSALMKFIRFFALSCTLLYAPFGSSADSSTSEIQTLTQQWIGLEHQKDLLKRNWRNDLPVLEQQLALLERENQELSTLLERTEADQGEVEERRLSLLEQQTRLELEQSLLEKELTSALIDVEGLYPQLPPPLVDAWDSHLPRLRSGLLNNSEKLQVILEMLGQLDDFQRKITLHQDVITLSDGNDYLVNQVYLGLSHGWYVSADSLYAGAGKASPDGWYWQESDEAEVIVQIIAILERRQNTELLKLPLQLDNTEGVQ